jgi:hypothetical protein
MAISTKLITASAAAIYTSSGANAITTIIVCNPTIAPIDLTMYAVPNTKSPATTGTDANVIVYQLAIPAGDTISFDQEKMVLGNGDSIQALGDGLVSTVSTLPV